MFKIDFLYSLFNSQTQEKQRDYDEAAIGVDTSSKDSVGSLEKEQVAKSQPRSSRSVRTAQSPRKSSHSNLGFAYDNKPSDKDWIDHSDYEHHNEVYSKHESSHRHETRDVPQVCMQLYYVIFMRGIGNFLISPPYI